ncbi:hypothetical protein BCR44DRAFT_1429698, partial [Catenaria anguillulae PL171]
MAHVTQGIVKVRINDGAHGRVLLRAKAGCFGVVIGSAVGVAVGVGVVRCGRNQGVLKATDLGITKQIVVPGKDVFAVDLDVLECVMWEVVRLLLVRGECERERL